MKDEDTLRQRWNEVDRLFEEVLALPPEARDRSLSRLCPDDSELRETVRSLLRAAATQPEEFPGPDGDLLAAALDRVDRAGGGGLEPGDLVGRYRVLKELGRGGMATVYEAERSDGTYHQLVALKVLRRGLDTDRIIERFRVERQILSDFAHPNVARLLDGGAMEDGRPYLVMERVDGQPITSWPDGRGLGERERLELFLQVTDAVAEAHRHLVVHRDIKPANVLVATSGRVKLLDFGIAKLLGPDGHSDLTELGSSPLTRRYASPEQRRGGAITTASDVYQLGLLLHELLTGEWPFDREGGGLDTRLEGDLDVIVRTALAPEVEDRYPSVEAFSGDIRRFLDGRPIEARPPTVWVRARKWIGRNPWAPPVAAVLLIGLVTYVGTLYVGMERLEREAARAERIKGLLVDLFQSADPFRADDPTRPDPTVAEALEPAVDRIRTGLADDPLAQADLLGSVGSVLFSIQEPERSRAAIEEAIRIRRELRQERTPAYASDLVVLASTLRQEHWDSAAAVLGSAVDILRAAGDGREPRLAHALAELMYLQLTRIPPADPALGEEALAIYREAGPGHGAETAGVLGHLAYVYASEGRLADAEAAAREALSINRTTRGGQDPLTALAALQLAAILDDYRRHEEAISLYLEAIPVLERVAGPTHNQTLTARNNLATTYQEAGRTADAVDMHRKILDAKLLRTGGEPDRSVGESMQNLAAALEDLGRLREADSLAARAYEVLVATTAEGHPVRAFPLLTRAEILLELGEPARAATVARGALEILQGSMPAGHYAIGVAHCRLGAAWIQTGRETEGSAYRREGLAMLEADERTPPEYVAECARAVEMAAGSDARP